MSIEPGVVVGIDRDYTDVDGNRTGLVRGLLQSGAEIEAGFMGTPPWPLASALFDGGPDWVCLGPLGHRRTLAHDDFLGIGEVTTVDTLQDWTDYTPTLTQSATVSKTITRARYRRMDDICFVELDLAVTGSGTAGQAVEIGLPLSTGMATGAYLAGTGVITNASASSEKYVGAPRVSASNKFTLQGAAQPASNPLGAEIFTEALANTDAVRASFWYSLGGGVGSGTPVRTTTQVDGWTDDNDTLSLVSLTDPTDMAGGIQLTATYPATSYLRKLNRQIALADDRIYWVSARVSAYAASSILRVGLADLGGMDPGTPAASTDSAVFAQLDTTVSGQNRLSVASGTSTTDVATGETFSASTPAWVDVMVMGGQWAAMWVDGSGPWMTNSNVPDTDTRWVTPFVSVATQVAGVTGAFIDCVTVEQVSQAVSPYDLSLFSAEYIADS